MSGRTFLGSTIVLGGGGGGNVASAHFSCCDIVRWLVWAGGKICVSEKFVDSDVRTRQLLCLT